MSGGNEDGGGGSPPLGTTTVNKPPTLQAAELTEAEDHTANNTGFVGVHFDRRQNAARPFVGRARLPDGAGGAGGGAISTHLVGSFRTAEEAAAAIAQFKERAAALARKREAEAARRAQRAAAGHLQAAAEEGGGAEGALRASW